MFRQLKFLLILLMILLSSFVASHAKEPVTSIQQLNNPQYTVGTDTDGPVLKITMENLPHAEILKFNELISQCFALNQGKIDAITGSELELRSAMRNGLENIRILPGYLGDPIPIAAGISERSEIPGLKEKFNAFIATIKADGTLSAMYKRWVDDNNMNMPVIDVPEKSDIHLTVATTGTVMPFSFYINSDVTGFDIELARRFAAHIGAEIEFKIYGFGSILMALKSGAVDLALSNLYVTPETKESVTFSDTIFELNCVAAVRDDGHKAKPQTQAEEPEIAAFSKKKIGVIIGASHVNIVREALPNAEVLYFNGLADIIQSLKNSKVDALALDEPVALEILHENPDLKISEGKLKTINNAFIFPKSSGNEKNEKLYNEFNEYIRRIKSDGTTDKLLSIWTGNDNSLKVIPDYSKLPDINGTIRLATDNEAPPFVFVKDGRLAGFDVDVVTRFCKEYGYRPYFDEMNFSGVIPSVITGKCDMGAGTLAVTPERSESVRFSEPVYSFAIVLVIRKPQDSLKAVPSGSVNTGNFSAFNGKRIGVFTGSVQYDMVREVIPDAKISYFDSIANITTALTAGKIDAAAVDLTIALEVERTNSVLTHTDESLGNSETAFLFPKSIKNNPLLDEINEYLRRIKSDGTLDEIRAVWTGDDESKKIIPDYSNYPAAKGTIRIAADNETPLFSYMKDRKLVGYDVDVIVRFCKEKGYKPEFKIINFTGLLAAVSSEKCDMGISGITVTPERSEAVKFSEPLYSFPNVLMIMKPEDTHESAEHTQSVSKYSDRIPAYKHLSDFDGKPIGMQPGVIDWENWVAENLPHSQVQYYNTYPDLASALKTRKIEGFLVDSPVLALMAAEDKTLTSVDEPVGKSFGYSFVYAKTEKGKKLCDEMSEFIRKIKASGELDAVHSKWQGVDESLKIPPDYKSLPAKNGTLTYAAEGSYPPFTYYKGTKLAGIDIDLAARFCEAYGYGLDVQTMFFDAMIPAVQSGKTDFAGDFTPSDEHEEAVYYSDPYCIAYSVMACLKDENSKSQTVSSSSGIASEPDSLAGKRIGVQTGTTCAELVPERIPSAKLSYYDSLTDELTALRAGKVDAICCSLPAAVFTENADPTLVRINPPLRETYLYPIFADNEKGKKLCDEYSEFLKTLWDNGTIDKLNQKWLGPDESSRIVDDYSQFPNTNGSVKMAVDTSLVPFAYVKDNQIVGYDVDLAVMFCKAKGYSLEIQAMSLSALITSVKTGKSDFSCSMNITEERSENTIFSTTPTIKSGNVLVVMKSSHSASVPVSGSVQSKNILSFWDDLVLSFQKTFIRENRWLLFAEGIANSMTI
ncbi:MAG: transporter substrate-binding domain-containing protein, partial [Synergistaceae bacterium]|nr:transporter substrate-binding domain-containing protein [Synergistaceae bacterium]